jgi:hypothetical protein
MQSGNPGGSDPKADMANQQDAPTFPFKTCSVCCGVYQC